MYGNDVTHFQPIVSKLAHYNGEKGDAQREDDRCEWTRVSRVLTHALRRVSSEAVARNLIPAHEADKYHVSGA